MGVRTPLTQRLTAWTKVRDVADAETLDNLALRDAARDLQVSFAAIRRARDALTAHASIGADAEVEVTAGDGPDTAEDAGTQVAYSGELTALPGVTPPAAHEVEGPAADLEALVDARTGAAPWRRPWERLGPAEQRAAKALGFGPVTWDAALDGSLEVLPSAFRTVFVELLAPQREAVRTLGFEPAGWDATVAARVDVLDNPDVLEAFVGALEQVALVDENTVRDVLLPAARDFMGDATRQERALLYLLDFHPHRFTVDARRALRDDVLRHTLRDRVTAGFTRLEHGGDRVVNDASGLVPTMVARVVRASSAEDVRRAIGLARVLGTRVSIAGRRRSQGGQSVAPGSVNLDMRGMSQLELLPNGNLRVEAGATWAQVQAALAVEERALAGVQSSNVFTVGGSIGVNAHGRAPGAPPIISTVEALKVMTADGRVLTCSRDGNALLFRHVIGGYGLFGVVLEAELRTRTNPTCVLEVSVVAEDDYLEHMDGAAADPDVELAWARLSPALNDELLFHRARRVDGSARGPATAFGGADREAVAALQRAVLRISQTGTSALEARWALEGRARSELPARPLAELASPSVELLSCYWAHEGLKTDILHEYFVPRSQMQLFLDGLRELQETRGMRGWSGTVRDVGEDAESALPYAREDVVGFELSYELELTSESDARHASFTGELVELALDCGGTFYLPYRSHYSDSQLRRGHPGIDAFFEKKRELDPNGLFSNTWFERYAGDA